MAFPTADERWMRVALAEAGLAAERGEVPVGAVLMAGDAELARAHNRTIMDTDPTAHAEVVCLREAASRGAGHRLGGTTLYVTLEPCSMCMGAALQARVERIVFGAYDPKAGAAETLYRLGDDPRLNHRFPVLGGILEHECADLLTTFFRARRS